MRVPIVLMDGRIEMSEFHKGKVRQALRDNQGPIRAEIHTLLPESRKQRAYLMGCLIPLIVYFDGNDYTDGETLERYFEFLKMELAPEVMRVGGKIRTFGQSTKGSKRLNTFIEKVQEYLQEQYGLEYSSKAINPDEYKKFSDEIYPFQTEYRDYLHYCDKLKWIKRP